MVDDQRKFHCTFCWFSLLVQLCRVLLMSLSERVGMPIVIRTAAAGPGRRALCRDNREHATRNGQESAINMFVEKFPMNFNKKPSYTRLKIWSWSPFLLRHHVLSSEPYLKFWGHILPMYLTRDRQLPQWVVRFARYRLWRDCTPYPFAEYSILALKYRNMQIPVETLFDDVINHQWRH